jgi:hypothetical protein
MKEKEDDNNNQLQESSITNKSKLITTNIPNQSKFPNSSSFFESFEKKCKEMEYKFKENKAKRISELQKRKQQQQ